MLWLSAPLAQDSLRAVMRAEQVHFVDPGRRVAVAEFTSRGAAQKACANPPVGVSRASWFSGDATWATRQLSTPSGNPNFK